MECNLTETGSFFPSRLAWDFGTGLFNLMQLLRFQAGAFCRMSGLIAQAWVLLNGGGNPDDIVRPLGATLGELMRESETLGLPLTVAALNRLNDAIDQRIGIAALTRQLTEIHMRVCDELEARLMIAVPAERAEYYQKTELFGAEVLNRFPSASFDITEAGKCLALDRNTACVFHLMRVMEIGLRALAATLGDPNLDPERNPSWESILRKCDQELAKPLAQRSAIWRSDETFFSGIAADLRAVKNAWRNPTMHVDQVYTDETAHDVWNAVRGFMRHLAAKLSDVSSASGPVQ